MSFSQTFPFNQANYPETGGGVCAVLSAYWIQLMREEKSIGPDARRVKIEQAVARFAPLLQGVYGSNWNSFTELNEKCRWVLRVAGSSDIEEIVHNLHDGSLTNYIRDLRRTGFHFNFGYKPASGAGWGHAVGIWRSGHGTGLFSSGHMYVFDPNKGEYKGNKSDLSQFIDQQILPQFGSPVGWTYTIKAVAHQQPKGKGILGPKVMF